MGDLMNIIPPEDELDLAAEEFEETYKAFEKAAKKLMAIMDSMNKKRNQELEALSGNSKQIDDFLIQMMDESGQIGEKCFGVKCMAEKEKKQQEWLTITATIVSQTTPRKLSNGVINR